MRQLKLQRLWGRQAQKRGTVRLIMVHRYETPAQTAAVVAQAAAVAAGYDSHTWQKKHHHVQFRLLLNQRTAKFHNPECEMVARLARRLQVLVYHRSQTSQVSRRQHFIFQHMMTPSLGLLQRPKWRLRSGSTIGMQEKMAARR